jgi:hypothetical protein
MYYCVITGIDMHKEQSRDPLRPPRRNGTPFTIYFNDQQTENLNRISRERRVPKAELVRFGVDLMLAQLSNGQLELPLGIDLPLNAIQRPGVEP